MNPFFFSSLISFGFILQFWRLMNCLQKHYYLDLLGTLCLCKGVYQPENQTYICNKWLEDDKVWH